MINTAVPTENLALYHYQSCPFCQFVGAAINDLGLNAIELRDIQLQPKHRSELIQQGGKGQVPCLRIESNEGEIQWLYESRDIIGYLKRHKKSL